MNKTRGEWKKEEDLDILEFVSKNGTKWVRISEKLKYRTEHSVKNRFFSLISNFMEIPIKKIKKEVNYINKGLIEMAIYFYKSNLENNKSLDNEVEDEKYNFNELSDEEICDLLTNSADFRLNFQEFLDFQDIRSHNQKNYFL